MQWIVIDEAINKEDLNKKEQLWIKHFSSCVNEENSNGYNTTIGGSSNLGYRVSDSTKEKLKIVGSGSKNSNAKLTQEQVEDIFVLLGKGIKQCEIARQFNISEGQLSKIKNGSRWKILQ